MLPDLPQIRDGNLMMDVFTHRSILVPPNEKYGDVSRLVELGRVALEMAATDVLFRRSPMMSLELLQVSSNAYPARCCS